MAMVAGANALHSCFTGSRYTLPPATAAALAVIRGLLRPLIALRQADGASCIASCILLLQLVERRVIWKNLQRNER